MKLRVRREAELDVVESAIWHNDAEVGLGEAFVDAVQNAYPRIERGPLHYQTIYGDVRMVRTRRFLHGVFFVARERSHCLGGSSSPQGTRHMETADPESSLNRAA